MAKPAVLSAEQLEKVAAAVPGRPDAGETEAGRGASRGAGGAGSGGASTATEAAEAPTLFFERDDGSTSPTVPVLLTDRERDVATDTCAALVEDYSWRDLFRSDILPLTLTFGIMEVAYNMAFYIIVFSAGRLSDQLLLNLVLLAAADLPGSTSAGILCDRVGSKTTAVGFLAGASATLFAFAAFEATIPTSSSADVLLQLVPAALSLLGKSLCSGAFTAIFLLFNENYPVTLRSAALGSGMMFGKMGASCASPLTASFPLAYTLGIAGGALLAGAASATALPNPKGRPNGE